MQNWVLFPGNTANKEHSGQEDLDMLLFLLSHDQRFMISKEEWNTLMPETKARLQGPALGFCCGDLSGGQGSLQRDLKRGLPEVSIRKFKSDFRVLQKAWNNDFSCVIKNDWKIPCGLTLFVGAANTAAPMTVAGMLSLEPSFFVWASKGTRFAKYRMPAKEFDKIITLDLQKR